MALPSEDIQVLLKEVIDHFDKEDLATRERQIRTARRLKLLWEGFQQAWYSEVAHDWRIWDQSQNEDTDQAAYDKPINVFRAYLESIIAALSITIPPIKCYPDDANDTLDISTAKAGDKIAQLIYRHNDAPLLWIHALFIYCTEGMVACYSYPREDEAYGTYEKKTTEETTEEHEYVKCPSCGYTMDDTEVTPELLAIRKKLELEKDKFQPSGEDVEIQDLVQNTDPSDICPACGQLVLPEITQEPLIITRIVGITQEPKSRVCMEAYGLLNVKVANYAKTQKDTPYLSYSFETHYSSAMEQFEHLVGKKKELLLKIKQSTGPHDPWEQWGRLPVQYQGEYPLNTVTIRNWWLRPSSFNVLPDLDKISILKKHYPNGVKVVMVNDCFGEACNESLDDCWTLTHNPLSDYIHYDPLGLLLVSIQEITNDLISLTLQTIEHGIPQTFADPGVVSFAAYRQMETVPGALIEATPKSGKSVGDAFHEVKTAALSSEVMPFSANIQSLAQLASGALPSLFGGQIEGSETASEYSMSRAQAQQRLNNTWKMFTIWWKNIFGKVVPLYITLVKEDEKDVQLNSNGQFINTFIRKAELEGKIGKIELEANENLPITWAQRKDVIEKLLTASSPEVMKMLSAPENIPLIHEAMGLADFFVPGEDDVIKQYDEIKLLLNSEPLPNPTDIDGTMPELPSVEVDPMFDNHPIEFEIVRKWVISEEGRQAKTDNPDGYRNVLLHGKLHFLQIQMQMQPPMPASPDGKGAAPNEKPKETDQAAPIMEESNVATVQ